MWLLKLAPCMDIYLHKIHGYFSISLSIQGFIQGGGGYWGGPDLTTLDLWGGGGYPPLIFTNTVQSNVAMSSNFKARTVTVSVSMGEICLVGP